MTTKKVNFSSYNTTRKNRIMEGGRSRSRDRYESESESEGESEREIRSKRGPASRGRVAQSAPSVLTTSTDATTKLIARASTKDIIRASRDYLRHRADILPIPKKDKALVKSAENITPLKVVEYMMKLLQTSGFPHMNDGSLHRLFGTLSHGIKREELIEEFKQLTVARHLDLEVDARSALTMSGPQLQKITQQSVARRKEKVYLPTWDIAKKESGQKQIVRINADQILRLNNLRFNFDSKKILEITEGEKIYCGDCWICGKRVYAYRFVFIDTNDKRQETTYKCGEDEHLLAPGIGNITGLLAETAADTVDRWNIAGPCLLDIGIRPSHKICNRIKSDKVFIVFEVKGGKIKYVRHQRHINDFMSQFKQWLLDDKKKKMAFGELEWFNKEEKEKFLTDVKGHLQRHIDSVVKEMNDVLEEQTAGIQLRTMICGAAMMRRLFEVIDDVWKKYRRIKAKGGAPPFSFYGREPEPAPPTLSQLYAARSHKSVSDRNIKTDDAVIGDEIDGIMALKSDVYFKTAVKRLESAHEDYKNVKNKIENALHYGPLNNDTKELVDDLNTGIQSDFVEVPTVDKIPTRDMDTEDGDDDILGGIFTYIEFVDPRRHNL